MKLTTILIQGKERIGLVVQGNMFHANELEVQLFKKETLPHTLAEGIQQGEFFYERIKEIQQQLQRCLTCEAYMLKPEEYVLLAPLPKPNKNVVCVGKNYREHAMEMGSVEDIPTRIMYFSKAPTSVIGHQGTIEPHWHLTNELDYEGELGVVIGKRLKNVSEEEAVEGIFGYTIINDVSARDIQYGHKQFFFGKSFDTYCPMGPVIVTKEEISNPQSLRIQTTVNGEMRQNGNTEDMIFSIGTILATLSKGMTLEPGDVVATGTPAGVGKGFQPPKLLRSGDVIEITIEGIGTLRNVIGE